MKNIVSSSRHRGQHSPHQRQSRVRRVRKAQPRGQYGTRRRVDQEIEHLTEEILGLLAAFRKD